MLPCPEPDLTTVIQGLCLYALGDIVTPITTSSWASWCSFLSQTVLCPLPLFKSHCGRWNWQPFLDFRLLFRQKRLHLASGIKTQDWRGHLTPFTSGGGPVSKPSWCPAPASLACWILHLAHRNARAQKKVASYCYSLLIFYPSKCLEQRGRSKESSASILERSCSYFIFLVWVFSSSMQRGCYLLC